MSNTARKNHSISAPGNRGGKRPHVELLEERIMLTAEPTATIDAPADAPLGGDLDFTITFENTDPTDVGFAPFVDLIVPTTGADGDDGFDLSSATFLGSPVTTFEIVFDASGEALHPLAVDSSGDPIVVNGTPGDTLVVFQLPFGSFAPSQTPVEIDVTLTLSDLADIDQPLDLQARGGFALGETPLDDSATDPSITQVGFNSTTVTPSLFTLTKTNNGDEEESATGPNFVRSYFIEVDIVEGQTLEDFIVTDNLPDTIVYLGATITTGSGTITTEPTIGGVVPTGSQLVADLGDITGAAGVDAVIQIDFYINDVDSSGNPVISPTSGDDTQTTNDIFATTTYDPIDPRDPITPITSDLVAIDNTIENRSIATQKDFTIVTDGAAPGLSPGDVLQFTIDIQISDYFSFGDLVVDDLLPDGLRLDGAFTPTLSVTEAGTNLTGGPVNFAGANFTETFNAGTGASDLQFRLSNELITRGLSGSDGVLQGGAVLGGGATTVTLTYQAIVQTNYITPNGAGDTAITQGDTLTNTVITTGSIRDNGNPAITLGTESDDSSASPTIVTGQLSAKEIAYINGLPAGANSDIQVGDEITFRVVYSLPLSSIEDLVISDFLPLPVFSAGEVTTFDSSANPGDTPPPAGNCSLRLRRHLFANCRRARSHTNDRCCFQRVFH